MQIPIKLAKPGEQPEWYLIELQGSIESTNSHCAGSKSIGNLFFTKQGEPILIIGHHELRGKEAKLDKPVLILRKQRVNVDQEAALSQDDHRSVKSTRISYEVAAVARQKLLFKTRPKPIVTMAKTVNCK